MIKIEKLQEVTDEMWEDVHSDNKKFMKKFLGQKHLSPQTLKQYESALKQFFYWVKEECDNEAIYDLKPRDALDYQNFLIERGLSSSAVKLKRSAVSSLCGYIEVYYSDKYPTFRNIYNKNIQNPPSAKRHEKVPLTKEQFEKLITELKKRNATQQVAYLLFSYSTGCRRAEARQLLREVVNYKRVKDKDGKEKPFYMSNSVRAKGRGIEGKTRKFAFDERAMKAIKEWEKERHDDCPYVFATKDKNGEYRQISANTFNYWCHKTFSDILGVRVHPHLLRSSRATHIVVNEGKDIKAAQKLLGHQDVTTTEIYVVRDDSEDLDDLF